MPSPTPPVCPPPGVAGMSRCLSALSLAVAATLPAQPTGPTRPHQQPTVAAVRSTAPMMAQVDTTVFRGLRYRMVGPNRGGRVTTVTGVPSQPKTFYMGVASGGLFRTTDGGARWYPITDG